MCIFYVLYGHANWRYYLVCTARITFEGTAKANRKANMPLAIAQLILSALITANIVRVSNQWGAGYGPNFDVISASFFECSASGNGGGATGNNIINQYNGVGDGVPSLEYLGEIS